MARFNWQRVSPQTDVDRFIALINERMLALVNFLQGIRRDGTSAVLEKGDIETEQAGAGLILKTPDGAKRYRITVSDTGTVTATLL